MSTDASEGTRAAAGNGAEHGARRPGRRLLARSLTAGVGLGVLSRLGARPAEAANGENVVAGQAVTGTSAATVVQGTVANNPALRAANGFAEAVDTKADGVQGFAAGENNAGVFGRNNALNGVGIAGAAPNGTGAYGESLSGSGVAGKSSTGAGVYGLSGSKIGVHGHSDTDIGVYADSGSFYGLYAVSQGIGGARTWAGVFSGDVYITGSYTATGAKSAAVRHPDGTDRRLYCMESPESYFEDFGRGQLAAGRADIRLDPDFAAVVRNDDYLVYLTPEGDSNGLYVTNRRPTAFEVREQKGGTSTVAFSYRIVAKRKDIAGPRFERVTPPPRLDGSTPPGPPAPPAPVSTPTPVPVPTQQATSVPSPTGTTAVPTATPLPPPATPTPDATAPAAAPLGSPAPSPTPTARPSGT